MLLGQDLCLVLLTGVMIDCSFLASDCSSVPFSESISTHFKFKKELGIRLSYRFIDWKNDLVFFRSCHSLVN